MDQKLRDVKVVISSTKKNQGVLESTAGKNIVKEVDKGTEVKQTVGEKKRD